jgi:hypothetical protein
VAYNLDYDGTVEPMWEDLATGRFAAVSEGYHTSIWLSDTELMISHVGPPLGTAAYAVYDLAEPASSHGPTDDLYLPEYLTVASRDGSRVAVYEDEPLTTAAIAGADIQLFAPAGNDVHVPGAASCRIPIPPANALGAGHAGPSFTPDGSQLAWAERDGVHVAATSNLDECTTVADRLLVPGGRHPFLSGARESIPKLTVRSSTRRARLPRSGAIAFSVTATLAATARVGASVAIPGHRPARLRSHSVALGAHRRTRITLRLTRPATAAVRHALRANRRVVATITLTAAAHAGGATTATLHVRLT